eukprot:113078_1
MGNTSSKEDNVAETFSSLINMGFNETFSIKAANKHPNNLNKAINYIINITGVDENKVNLSMNACNPDHHLQVSHISDITHNGNVENECFEYGNQCNDIKKCKPLNKLIKELKLYQKYNKKDTEMRNVDDEQYIQLINSYHHMLYCHSKNRDCEYIHNCIISENDLFCDINKCQIYVRNSRITENDCHENVDKNTGKYIALMDVIHSYFIHAVDIGFRIVNENVDINNDDNDNENNVYFDRQLAQLQSYLQ